MGLTRYDEQYHLNRPDTTHGHVVETPEYPKRYLLHTLLFFLTFASCTLAGLSWMGGNIENPTTWLNSILYAALMMGFIASHEFGHYFAARYHGIDATLPYFIPMPFLFGTMGAVIRTRSPFHSRAALFDVGIAGPLAGFAVCVAYLIIGFVTLPGIDYIYQIHPEYKLFNSGHIPVFGMTFGDSILFHTLAAIFSNSSGFMPPMNEVYHYPFLCVGWFGLFVTSLNLLPVGQLDGGHILYAMYGKLQGIVARITIYLMFILGLSGLLVTVLALLQTTENPDSLFTFLQESFLPPLMWLKVNAPVLLTGWGGWMFWALFARFFFKPNHPDLSNDEPIDNRRMILGWVAILIFVTSISLNGIYESEPDVNAIPFMKSDSKQVINITPQQPTQPSRDAALTPHL